jgi:AraC-like DNA-binding protein
VSEPVLQPVTATDRFTAFRHTCVGDVNATIVDIEQPTLATPLQGAATLFVGGSEVHVEPLQIVVVRPGHRVRALHHGCSAEACAMLVGISESTALGRMILDQLPEPALTFSIPPRWVIRLRCLFDRRPAMPAANWEAVERALCRQLGAELVARENGSRNEGDPRIWELVEAVRRRLADDFDRQVSLDELSEATGVSKYHLARTFHEKTGYPIHHYQTLLRLEAALVGLWHGEQDLTRLALTLGFSSHSHFTSVFRRLLGATPSAVRSILFGVDDKPE